MRLRLRLALPKAPGGKRKHAEQKNKKPSVMSTKASPAPVFSDVMPKFFPGMTMSASSAMERTFITSEPCEACRVAQPVMKSRGRAHIHSIVRREAQEPVILGREREEAFATSLASQGLLSRPAKALPSVQAPSLASEPQRCAMRRAATSFNSCW